MVAYERPEGFSLISVGMGHEFVDPYLNAPCKMNDPNYP